MSSVEDKIRELSIKHLGHDANFDVGVGESEVSSLDMVAFLKKVGEAFDITISNVDAIRFQNLRDLVEYIEARR